MIVKIHSRGKGGGKGPVQYLLGKDGLREDARLDQGNPSEVIELIDGLKFAQKYTSGVLSFAEKDLPEKDKKQIMEGFERTLFPGLDKDQFSILWVQHKDKDRLELNFVIPNVELTTGKRLQPYYHKADLARVNSFKVMCNANFKLADPDDPLRRRVLSTPNDLPPKIAEAQELITDGLLNMANAGEIKNRSDVIKTLENKGFSIARTTKKSISIKNPSGEPNARNIRLSGALYEESFNFGAGLQSELKNAGERYQARASERLSDAIRTYKSATEVKHRFHSERFQRSKTNSIAVEQSSIPSPTRGASRHSSFDNGLVPISKRLRAREREAEGLGRVHSGEQGPLSDQGGSLDDGVRERAIESCRSISEGAKGRARTYTGARNSTFQHKSIATAAARCTEYAVRAIGAVSEAIKHVAAKISEVKPNIKGDEQDVSRGPLGPSMR